MLAPSATVICVLLTKVMGQVAVTQSELDMRKPNGSLCAPYTTSGTATKLDPVRVSVIAAPAATVAGDIEASTGALLAAPIEKVNPVDVPPPGVGLNTVTCTEPALAMSVAKIAAVNRVLLTNVVVRLAPFHCTTEPETKLEPLTASVKAAPPAVAPVGESELAVGMGLLAGALMVKDSAVEVPPPGAGLTTVTGAVPTAVISAARMAAVNWLALTKVVTRLDPFHWTVAPFTKFEPFTVSVKFAPPAVALDGEREVSVGIGLELGTIKSHMPRP